MNTLKSRIIYTCLLPKYYFFTVNKALRLNLVRESLPQLVQDYVQSQASIAVQNYKARLLRELSAGGTPTTPTGTVVAASGAGVATSNAPSVPGIDNATALSSNSRTRSVSNATTIYPAGGTGTPQAQKVSLEYVFHYDDCFASLIVTHLLFVLKCDK